jgi:hypothetical protein
MKPIAHHLHAGSYRADRHGPLPANVLQMPPAHQPWAPSEDDLAVIGPAGREFIEQMVGTYDFTLIEGTLLREAGQAVAALAAVRAVPRAGRSLREVATLERLELAWSKQLVGLLGALKVQHETS